eukprot:6726601-Pyramimonas_sp.AAC.1
MNGTWGVECTLGVIGTGGPVLKALCQCALELPEAHELLDEDAEAVLAASKKRRALIAAVRAAEVHPPPSFSFQPPSPTQ